MGKLFAFEDKEESGNELIIDKLLDKKAQPSSPMSLTADLLKQRDQINKEVTDHIEETKEEEEEESTDDTDSEEEDNTSEEEEETEEDTSDSDKEGKQEEADSKESLDSLIGSGLEKDEDKESDKDKQVAEESFNSKATLRNIFTPIRLSHEQYLEQLAPYNLSLEALKPEQQPVTYVKEAIIESINRLNKLASSYITNIVDHIETFSDSLKTVNEKVVVLTGLVENNRHQFTHRIVKDRDVIQSLSFKGHSDVRETSRALANYLDTSNNAISLIVNNSFNDISKSLTSASFVVEHDDLVYPKQLPGFIQVRVGLVPYQNYLKTKIENYQYYTVKAFKVEDLYELPGISITEDKEIEYIVKTLNKLVLSTGVSIDTLKGITEHFHSFMNELKVLSFDVQQDKRSNLADLGIDAKVQDFIKFKLATEALLININMSMDYISSISSVLDICLELAE